MNAKISVSVICVEAIIYLLLYNLHDCTFEKTDESIIKNHDDLIVKNLLYKDDKFGLFVL